MRVSYYRKAVLAGVGGLLAFLAPVVDDGVSLGELLGALAAALAAGGLVYGVPNAPDLTET